MLPGLLPSFARHDSVPGDGIAVSECPEATDQVHSRGAATENKKPRVEPHLVGAFRALGALPLVIAVIRDRPPHERRRQPVVPLLRQGAELAVELPHGDALGVQDLVLDDLGNLPPRRRNDPVAFRGVRRSRGGDAGGQSPGKIGAVVRMDTGDTDATCCPVSRGPMPGIDAG